MLWSVETVQLLDS